MVLDGLLEDNDCTMSQSQEDGLSQASGSTVTTWDRQRKRLRQDLHLSDTSSANNQESDGPPWKFPMGPH